MRYETMSRFEFDEEKAAAATAVLLKGRRMPHHRLATLLYAADRESLRLRGRPISGGPYLSTEHGPAIDLRCAALPIHWVGDDVELAEDPGLGALSESEVEILATIRPLRVYPEAGAPGELITPEFLLRAIGKTTEESAEIIREAEESSRVKAFFRGGVHA